MSRFVIALFLGCAIGIVVGVLSGDRCKGSAFQEQVDRHGCRLRDVEMNGVVVVNMSCELPDGTIVKKY